MKNCLLPSFTSLVFFFSEDCLTKLANSHTVMVCCPIGRSGQVCVMRIGNSARHCSQTLPASWCSVLPVTAYTVAVQVMLSMVVVLFVG